MTDDIRIRVVSTWPSVIPALFRKALGIAAGGELRLRLEDHELRITTKQRHVQRAQEGTRR